VRIGQEVFMKHDKVAVYRFTHDSNHDPPSNRACVASLVHTHTMQVMGYEWIFFVFDTASRPALGPTNLPIRWVLGTLSSGVKWPGREANQLPPSSAEVKNAWSCVLR